MKWSQVLLCLSLLLLPNCSEAQRRAVHKGIDFMSEIKKYDIGILWRAEHIDPEGEGRSIPFPEPLGFIGTNFQRFFIHITSVQKSSKNPYLYLVRGKTRVRNIIRSFHGTIRVTDAILDTASNEHAVDAETVFHKTGSVECSCQFVEDGESDSNGFIVGKMESHWYLDGSGRLVYDAIEFHADGFCNNQFIGTWTNCQSRVSMPCHWGDYRIPDCGELDIGAGEFSVNEQYRQNGWQSYSDAMWGDARSARAIRARKFEELKWWK